MLGISTCWWEGKDIKGHEIPSQALDMGFQGLELDYRITAQLLSRLRTALRSSISVWSVHNVFPCPVPVSGRGTVTADPLLLSSRDKEERAQAVRWAVNTVEQACDLEAPAVVLHLGKVDMEDPTAELQDLFRKGASWSPEAQERMSQLRSLRESRRQPNLDAVLFSLDRIHKEADKRGIILGIENRLHFHEIPDIWEIGFLLQCFEGGRMGYWHDVGHARVQEKLGILKQEELLKKYAPQMVGIHLHDVVDLEDHHPPGKGDVDFGEVAAHLSERVIKILEVKSSANVGEIREAVASLQKFGIT
ncbi:MAG: TIM barrel protein [bacterium]